MLTPIRVLLLIGAISAVLWVGYSARDGVDQLKAAVKAEQAETRDGSSEPLIDAAEHTTESPSAMTFRRVATWPSLAALLLGGVWVARRRLRSRAGAAGRRNTVVKVGDLAPGSVRILIVDDDSDLRVALCARLQGWGYVTKAAWDGVSAITASRERKPTLMILDLGMPRGDGFTVMKRLSEIGITQDVPIIVLTGSDSDQIRERALDSGAVTFLQKPVDNDALHAAIEGTIVTRRG